MKVAVVGPTYPFRGGISHFNTLMCEHLRKTHDVSLYTFRRQYPRWLFPGRDNRDPSQDALSTPSIPILDPMCPTSWWRTGHRVVAGAPDILVFHWWVTFWAPPFAVIARIARRYRIPILYLCHNVLPHEERIWDPYLARMALSLGDEYVVMSEAGVRELQELLPRATVHQAFHPTYSALVQADRPIPTEEARRQLGLDPDKPVALFFGFVREYKGLRYLLEALPGVLDQTEIGLLIVGEFWEDKQQYTEMIDRLGISGSVSIVDRYVPNEEVPTYFYAADVVVLPYTSVTQSGVVQLAYGAGKPVITTSIGELPNVVIHHKTGLIVPPRDSRALAEALNEFYQTLETRNWEGEIARVRESYSWDSLVQTIERFWQDNTGAEG